MTKTWPEAAPAAVDPDLWGAFESLMGREAALQQLRGFRERLDTVVRDSAAENRVLAHKLAGQAGVLGLTDLSDASERLDSCLSRAETCAEAFRHWLLACDAAARSIDEMLGQASADDD